MHTPTLIALVFAASGLVSAIPDYAATIRPPAFPLAVRNPYTNIWLPANTLPGNWPAFWTGKTKGWTGMIKVDTMNYVWMGHPMENGSEMAPNANQLWTAITPTQTIFGIRAGAVDLNVTFFTPVEISDIRRQSIPLSYVTVSAASNDGASHDCALYMDISGEWASSNDAARINWAIGATPAGLKVWSTSLQAENKFGEFNEYAEWGYAVLAGPASASHMSGSDLLVRGAFISTGALPGTNDPNFRPINQNWPTFGFAQSLGSLGAAPVETTFVVGNVRDTNINWLNIEDLPALWLSYWSNFPAMLDFFWDDLSSALETASALDTQILTDAFNSAGQYYADILALSLRQSYAGNEFSNTAEDPHYYQKEISSGAFMQTVDVIFPTAPMWYYTNITYLQLLLEPLFIQMETGVWTKEFAMHDIGDLYPNALGQGYGGDMPVEESANMILMVADIVYHPTAVLEESVAYVRRHYEIMAVWANYLHGNCLYPVDQLTTDDFIGETELNSGLALKGILGMKAFAMLSELVGNSSNADFYNAAVEEFIPIWRMESMHNSGDHLKMEYNVTDGYQFKYNAFHDKLLGLGVVPEDIYEMEAAYYLTKLEPYGIPFCSIRDFTKSDWEMWTAAAFGDANPELRSALVEALGRFLRVTPQRVPFTDWYTTATSNHVGFVARPVVGGHFALLALEMAQKHRNQMKN